MINMGADKQTAAVSPDGNTYEYRLVSSRLERRRIYSGIFHEVTGADFLRMTPHELRIVANVLEQANDQH
jgi:hypothetical protein